MKAVLTWLGRIRNLFLLAFALVVGLVLYTIMDVKRQHDERLRASAAISSLSDSRSAVNRHFEINRALPGDLRPFLTGKGLDREEKEVGRVAFVLSAEPQRFLARFADDQGYYANKTLFLTPYVETGELKWRCSAPDVNGAALPATCR